MQTLLEADQGRRVCRGASCRLRTQVKPLQHAEPPLRRPTIILVEDDLSLIGADGLHPNANGYHKIADTFFALLRQQLEVSPGPTPTALPNILPTRR